MPSPRSFLQVVHGWPPARVGGTELYARWLMERLARWGDSRAFAGEPSPSIRTGGDRSRLSPRGDGAPNPDRVCLARPVPAQSYRETWQNPSAEALFAECLDAWRPQVVHVHHLDGLSVRFPVIATRAGARVVATLHDYALLCPRGQLVNHLQELCEGPRADGSNCATCLGPLLGLAPWNAPLSRWAGGLPQAARSWLRRPVARLSLDEERARAHVRLRHQVTRRALEHVQVFLSPSRDLAERCIGLGLPRDRVRVLPLPLLAPISHGLLDRPLPPVGPVRFLFVGSVVSTKGPHRLVEAFARLPAGAATLRIVGPLIQTDLAPTFARDLADRVRELPGIRMDGPVPHGVVPQILWDADVLVVPSTWHENHPLVVREALALGLRILASRRGGLPEMAPGATFFDPDVPDALLDALRAEVRRGRGRVAPDGGPSPEAHLDAILSCYGDTASPSPGSGA